ncbi:hypothetical protein V8E53_014605 [Lactarius tabidus]
MKAHYDIFRHHLLMRFPAFGHALWEPEPGDLYPAVKIGDVGYIREGKFHRLFNALLPAEDESHADFGVPEHHEPITLSVRKHINTGRLGPNNFCSAKVTSIPVSKYLAEGPDEIPKVTFSCPRKEGAVSCLPVQAKTEDTIASAEFGKWIIRHIDSWFAWAQQLGLGVNRMEDIILVTGTHCTKSCTNVAFLGGQVGAQVSFGAKVDRSSNSVAINWHFSHEQNRGVVLNCGPEGEDLQENQCIFIRGFRAARMLKILPPRLKGAAGPNPDPDGYDREPDAEPMPKLVALPEYQDPLHLLLEYIAETAPPDCDMVLVHDDDLARLDGRICDSIPLDSLQSGVMSSHMRGLKPTTHFARIDLSPGMDAESTCVATLSNIFEKRVPSTFCAVTLRKMLSASRKLWSLLCCSFPFLSLLFSPFFYFFHLVGRRFRLLPALSSTPFHLLVIPPNLDNLSGARAYCHMDPVAETRTLAHPCRAARAARAPPGAGGASHHQRGSLRGFGHKTPAMTRELRRQIVEYINFWGVSTYNATISM